jgi:hypothetical protein
MVGIPKLELGNEVVWSLGTRLFGAWERGCLEFWDEVVWSFEARWFWAWDEVFLSFGAR